MSESGRISGLAAYREWLGDSFHWHDGLLVGHRHIDADHRRFFAFFTGMADRLGDSARLEPLFMAILDDLDRHLAMEEFILGEIGYPGLSAHRASHRMLGEQAGAALSIGRDGEWMTALRLLGVSVLEHITEDDRQFRPFLAAAARSSHSAGGVGTC